MPTNEELEDTQVVAAEGDTHDETQEESGEAQKLVLGKYKSEEEAVKGYKELERKLHETATENARLKESSDMKEAISKIAEMASGAGKKEEPDAYKAYLAELAEKFREEPGEGVEKLTALVSSWIADGEKKITGDTDKKFSQLQNMIVELKETLNPDYQEHKDIVDKMVGDGMPRAKAIEWAKEFHKPSRVIPVSVNGGRARETTKKDVYLTREDRERMKGQDGLTDEDLDLMEADYQARKARKVYT